MTQPASDERRRGGRRPGKQDTRRLILDSARKLLASGQCADASLRAIARDAGVDAALITHYFGSRDGLLREALRSNNPIDLDFPALVAAGPPERFGERIVADFLDQLDTRHDQPHPLVIAFGLGTDHPVALELFDEVVERQFTVPLTAVIAETGLSARPEVAAQLVGLQVLSLSLVGELPGMRVLTDGGREELVRTYGALVQCALTS